MAVTVPVTVTVAMTVAVHMNPRADSIPWRNPRARTGARLLDTQVRKSFFRRFRRFSLDKTVGL